MDGVALLTIFVLAVFVGFEVVSKVSSHPAHAADVRRERDPRDHPGRRDPRGRARGVDVALVVGLVAVVLATVNLVGGFVVTDRMLEMFKAAAARGHAGAPVSVPVTVRLGAARATWSPRSASSSRSRACPRRVLRGAAT